MADDAATLSTGTDFPGMSPGRHGGKEGRWPLTIAEIVNSPFAYRHFVQPLVRRLEADGHRIMVLCPEAERFRAEHGAAVELHDIPLLRSLDLARILGALARMRALLKAGRPDVAHCHMPISGAVGRLAARLAGVPRIAYTCHGFLFNQPGSWWRRRLSLATERFCGRFTDLLMTVSEAEAEDARRLRLHPDPIAVGNGRDPTLFRFDPEARDRVRQEHGVSPDECVIVSVARLVEHKGLLDLVDVMPHLFGAWRIWIVGDRVPGDRGPDVKHVLEQAQDASGGRLRLLGMRDDIPAVLSAADVFCLPSHFEGLPMSIIEAMLVGLPVVASDIKGVRELVEHRRTGFLPAPNAPQGLAWFLNELITRPEQRRAFGEAGRRKALDRFTEELVLGRVVTLLSGAPVPRITERASASP
jgi:glycosyltransferase involved in cell wall biosynthesis